VKSVELFHLYYKGDLNFTYLLGQYTKYMDLASQTDPRDVRVVMLDDQFIPKKKRAVYFAPSIALATNMKVDFAFFETDLNACKDEWLSQQDNDVELRTKIKRAYNGNLQCSHYIAISYLLRLGLLEEPDGLFMPLSIRAMLGHVFPIQSRLLNYLDKSYQEVEDLTERDILLHNRNWSSDFVERIYV